MSLTFFPPQTQNNFTHQVTKCTQHIVAGQPTSFGVIWQICTLTVSMRKNKQNVDDEIPKQVCKVNDYSLSTTPSQSTTLVLYTKKLRILLPTAHLFLGSFPKLQKATISFVISVCLSVCLCLSVCPSVRIELGPHWTDFHYIWHLNIFRPSVEKTQVLLKSDNNNRYFT